MLSKHYNLFIGCPLFGLTMQIAPRGETPIWPNPTDHLLWTSHSPSGAWHLWLGQRVNIIFEPRSLRPASPLLVIE